MTQLITTELVELDQNLGSSPEDVIRHLAGRVAANGRATEVEGLFADAFARESKTATGVPGGIAIPHCRSTAVTEPTLAMARLSQPVDFGAKDGPADLIFFIAAPEGADQEHLKLLSKLARSLIKKDFTAALRAAGSEAEVVELVEGALADKPAAAPEAAAARQRPQQPARRNRGRLGRRARSGRGTPPQAPRRRHRLPHRHRPHLHGRRLARRRGQGSRRRPAGGNPGVLRRQGPGPRRDRRRRRRDLRRGRGCARQGAFRRHAGHQRPGQARHRRAGQDGRRKHSPPRTTRTPAACPTSAPKNRPNTRPRKRASTSAPS